MRELVEDKTQFSVRHDLIRFRRTASLHNLEVTGLAGSAARDAAST
jgi:hypothetical protein